MQDPTTGGTCKNQFDQARNFKIHPSNSYYVTNSYNMVELGTRVLRISQIALQINTVAEKHLIDKNKI